MPSVMDIDGKAANGVAAGFNTSYYYDKSVPHPQLEESDSNDESILHPPLEESYSERQLPESNAGTPTASGADNERVIHEVHLNKESSKTPLVQAWAVNDCIVSRIDDRSVYHAEPMSGSHRINAKRANSVLCD
jgi:hypothetical protein